MFMIQRILIKRSKIYRIDRPQARNQGRNTMDFVDVLLILAGAFSLLGGILDWDWFMNGRKAQLIVKLFKRTGARVFYGLIGIVLIAAGLLPLFGVM